MKPIDKYPRGEDALPAELNNYFEEFFLSENKRLPGQDIYEDIFSSPLLFPLQRKREMAFMMQKARSIEPKVVYEIGADKAGGLYHWCKCLPTVKRVIACEIRGTPYSELFEKAFPQIDFFWLPDSSYAPENVSNITKWLCADKIDCLFIDGDKCKFDKDFKVYLPAMNPRGIVFMHDIQDKAPRFGYDTICKKGYRHEEFIDVSESIEAVEREKQGISTLNTHEQWLRHWHGRSAGVGIIYLKK